MVCITVEFELTMTTTTLPLSRTWWRRSTLRNLAHDALQFNNLWTSQGISRPNTALIGNRDSTTPMTLGITLVQFWNGSRSV